MNTREPGLGAGDSTERMKRAPSPEPRAPSRLPGQVKLFGWVSLLNDFASEMIYPLLPAFVTGVLGGGAQSDCSAAWVTRAQCWGRSSPGGCSRPGARTCER